MINMGFDFERRLNDMLRNSMSIMSVRPITLGGIIGPSGGVGGPVGGYIGQLAQSFITYDTTEAAINTPVVVSGFSLVTNLNKIRYDIAQLGMEIDALTSGTGAQYFIDLLDTPANYTGSAGKAVVVNGTEDGVEFVTFPAGVDTFLELTDTPDSYTGQNDKYVKVNAGGTALEFVTISGAGGVDNFLDLTDTPNDYTGHGGKSVVVNGTEDGLEFVTISGGSMGALNDLTDVTITTPTSGEVLTYNGSEWINQAGGAGISSIDDLTDVIITDAMEGDTLYWNGTEFVNAPLAGRSALLGNMATDYQIVSDNTEQEVFSCIIPAGNLDIDCVVAFSFHATVLNNTGSGATVAIAIKLGDTVMWKDASASLVTGATLRSIYCTGQLGGNNGTSAQNLGGMMLIGANSAATTGYGDLGVDEIISTTPFTGTAAEDASGDLTLSILITLSANNANLNFTLHSAVVYVPGSAVILGAALNLADLQDVALGALTDGQVLTWDSGFNAWINADPAGGGDVSADAIWNAKGDLAVGTGADTATRLAVGTNGKVLMADSTQTTGLKWETPTVPSLDGLSDVVITDPVNYETIVYIDGTWVNMETVSGESSDAVASDVIWDAKGDLAVGTGANTAQKLAAGTDGQILVVDSTQTTGLKWDDPAGGTLYGYKVFDPDIPPASGTAFDDEFNDSSIDAKWTFFDPNTPDQFVATETDHGLELRKTTVSGKVAGYIQDFSSLTSGQCYSIFTKVSAMGTKYSVGLLFANDAYNNPSTADLCTAGMIFDSPWATGQRMEWSSYATSTSEMLIDVAIGEKTFYIRCRIRAGGDSGATDTHVYIDYSPDGYNWVERDNFYTNFLANQVGIYVMGYDTDDARAQATVHFFRYKAESVHEGESAWYSQIPGGQFVDK